MSDKTQVIFVVKNFRQSLAHDAMSIATFVGMIGIGVLLNSQVMQWAAAALWLIWIFGWASSQADKNRMTVAEARKRLDELEAE